MYEIACVRELENQTLEVAVCVVCLLFFFFNGLVLFLYMENLEVNTVFV